MNQDSTLQTKALRAYERHIAVVLIAVMLGLGLLSIRERASDGESTGEEAVRVHIVGAVGETDIAIARGTTVDEALKNVQLNRMADVTEIDGNRRIMRDETIVIPYAGKVTLYVTGAVESPNVVVLEEGAKAEDILAHVTLKENADRCAFMRRKKFTTGTVIEIKPKRTQSRKRAS